jgi:hypothetical protein
MSLREFAKHIAKKEAKREGKGGPQKYRNERTEGFPSKLERDVYQILCLRERAGEIRDIKRQTVVVLQDGPPAEKINWKIDFSFTHCLKNETWFAEAKGIESEGYLLKLKLFRARPHGVLEIWKSVNGKPDIVETIFPKETE